jgi:hypothetical protein
MKKSSWREHGPDLDEAQASGLAADAGRLEAGHLVEEGDRRLHQRPGQRGAGAFAQAQVELDQRLGPGGRAARGGRPRPSGGRRRSSRGRRRDARGGEQRRGDDEAVDQQQSCRASAAPSMAPAIITISKPPNSASTSSGSASAGRRAASACASRARLRPGRRRRGRCRGRRSRPAARRSGSG